MTSALVLSQFFEDNERNVLSNNLMKIISNSNPIKQGDNVKMFLGQTRVLTSMTSPILLLVRVRLASQRGGRFDKSTNENA